MLGQSALSPKEEEIRPHLLLENWQVAKLLWRQQAQKVQ
jgi:hypothetical protein